jgi:hypothetical protein
MPQMLELDIHEYFHRPLPREYCSAPELHSLYSAQALDFFKRHAHDKLQVPTLIYAVYEKQHCLRIFECAWADDVEKALTINAIHIMFSDNPPDRYCYQSEIWLATETTAEGVVNSPPPSERPDRQDGLMVMTVDRQWRTPLFQTWVRIPMGEGVSVEEFGKGEEGSYGGRLADLLKPLDEEDSMSTILREVSRGGH